MNLLKSRVPYMTDEAWTVLVMSKIDPDTPHDISQEERVDSAESIILDSFRAEQLGFAKEPQLDLMANPSEDVSMGEARVIREMYAKLGDVELVSNELNISQDLIEEVLCGNIWSYAGGPLRYPVLSGLNEEKSAYTANQKRFTKACYALARREFDEDRFTILCENNGLTRKQCLRTIKDLERRNDKLNRQRYRSIIQRHSEGASIEVASRQYARRGRPRK